MIRLPLPDHDEMVRVLTIAGWTINPDDADSVRLAYRRLVQP